MEAEAVRNQVETVGYKPIYIQHIYVYIYIYVYMSI